MELTDVNLARFGACMAVAATAYIFWKEPESADSAMLVSVFGIIVAVLMEATR